MPLWYCICISHCSIDHRTWNVRTEDLLKDGNHSNISCFGGHIRKCHGLKWGTSITFTFRTCTVYDQLLHEVHVFAQKHLCGTGLQSDHTRLVFLPLPTLSCRPMLFIYSLLPVTVSCISLSAMSTRLTFFRAWCNWAFIWGCKNRDSVRSMYRCKSLWQLCYDAVYYSLFKYFFITITYNNKFMRT